MKDCLNAGHAVALDLSTMSRYHNIELAGGLGYPDLRSRVLTIDYPGEGRQRPPLRIAVD